MKNLLILIFTLAAAATAAAQSGTFTAPVRGRTEARPQRQAPEPTRPVPVGAFPRAARGNAVQMLNPGAPPKYYGPPQETVVPAAYTHAGTPRAREEPQYAGLILFGFRW
jgi:curli biogenesis system outer membrane secretion channel CsgG